MRNAASDYLAIVWTKYVPPATTSSRQFSPAPWRKVWRYWDRSRRLLPQSMTRSRGSRRTEDRARCRRSCASRDGSSLRRRDQIRRKPRTGCYARSNRRASNRRWGGNCEQRRRLRACCPIKVAERKRMTYLPEFMAGSPKGSTRPISRQRSACWTIYVALWTDRPAKRAVTFYARSVWRRPTVLRTL